MRKYCFCIVVPFLLIIPLGRATLFQKDKELKEYQRDEEQYQPYKLKNTIEGYKEFIFLYPENLFVGDAKLKIENLEFLKKLTEEGSITPIVDKCFPLEEIANAIKYYSERHAKGKVVIKIEH